MSYLRVGVTLHSDETQEVRIPKANLSIRIEARDDKILVSRIRNSNYINIYEEYKTIDGSWGGRVNPNAEFSPPPKTPKCLFCNKRFPENLDWIAEEGWAPSFWMPALDDPEWEVFEPVCGDCCDNYLEIHEESGELNIKQQFIGAVLMKVTKYSREKIDSLVRNYLKRRFEPFTIYVYELKW